MNFIQHMEIYPNYEEGLFDNYNGTQRIATNSFLKDGNILYLMGGTVLCKYDISDSQAPKLLNRTDIAADHTGDPAMDYIRKESAHSTAIVDIGNYLVIALRGGGGGVTNMADGVIVGNVSIVNKETLEKVKQMKAVLFVPAHADATEDIVPLAQYNIDAVLAVADKQVVNPLE